jgi:hypothetical protein
MRREAVFPSEEPPVAMSAWLGRQISADWL